MSQELWDRTHQKRTWGRYPDVDIVTIVLKQFSSRKSREGISVLDLGCGAGANSFMLIEEGFTVHGIDFAPKAIERLRVRLAESASNALQNFVVGDFKNLPWPDNFFDVIVDCMAIYANDTATIEKVFQEIRRVLKKNGRFVSRSWGIETMMISAGERLDEKTIVSATSGPCAGFGVAHFFDQQEISRLFSDFDIDVLKKITKADKITNQNTTEWTVSGILR